MSLQTRAPATSGEKPKRGWRFWLVIVAICLCILLVGIDTACVATALPVIVSDLGGGDSFAWVASSYTLAGTALMPFVGRLSEIFGRRPTLLGALGFFTLGSIVCAVADNMQTLIVGRTLQGVGNGGILTLAYIIVADLTTLQERGLFQSLIAGTFTFAGAAGPFIGGAIADGTTWRWIFYVNLPLCAIAAVVVTAFLHLKKPEDHSIKEALLALDWIGNFLIIGSATSVIIALTWAGVVAPWTSVRVLVPLVIGLLGLGAALVYEARIATHPSIPLGLINNRTSLSGYVQSFLHGIVVTTGMFYLPIYFQGAKAVNPFISGVHLLPLACVISPCAIVSGIVVSKTGRYWMLILAGWGLTFVGVGLCTLLTDSTPIGLSVPIELCLAMGFGFIYETMFPVLAPLPATMNAQALAFLAFTRTFSQSWSVAIGASVLQNELKTRLPQEFLSRFNLTTTSDFAYAAVPHIRGLEQPLQDNVKKAFADSVRVLWQVMLGVCGAGVLCVFAMRELPLHSGRDERWGMESQEKEREASVERGEAYSTENGQVARSESGEVRDESAHKSEVEG